MEKYSEKKKKKKGQGRKTLRRFDIGVFVRRENISHIQREKQTDRQRQTDRQTDRETDRDRQTDRQTDTERAWLHSLLFEQSTVSRTFTCTQGLAVSVGVQKEQNRLQQLIIRYVCMDVADTSGYIYTAHFLTITRRALDSI